MGFAKGNNTSTSTSQANPAAMSAYYGLLDRASGVANTPYQSYGGEFTAPVNQQQQTGIGNINANAGFANPFVQQAGQDINSGVAPITGADIQNYQDPYTQQVVDATQAQFATDNARQQSQVTGNAAAQEALGGNRVGVAQALTAEGQQRAQAPVIAGLYSQGFQNAQTQAGAEKNRDITGGNSLAGVGIAGQGAALSGAGAQVGAGTLEQQTQQQQDLAQLQEFFRQQAYPFQTTQWLSGIDTGVGSNLGGTSTSTPPPPNPWNTALGLGVAGLGAFAKRGGGRVAGFAAGGTPGPDYSGMPYGDAQGWVPTLAITKGSGAPKPPGATNPQSTSLNSDQMKGAASLMGKAKDWYNSPGAPIDLSPKAAGVDLSDFNTFVGPTQPAAGLSSLYAEGGAVGPEDFRRGFATDGFVGPMYDDFVGPMDPGPVQAGFGTGSIVPFNDRFASVPAAPDMADPKVRALRNKLVDVGATSTEYDDPMRKGVAAGPLPDPVEVKTAGVAEPAAVAPSGRGPKGDDFETQSVAYAPQDRSSGFGEPMAPEPEGKKGLFSGLNLSPEAKQGLIAAGFGIMASRSPFLGQAVGEGGIRGVHAYEGAKEATLNAEKTKADIQHGKDQLAQQAENARNAVKQHSDQLAQAQRLHDIPSGFRKTADGNLEAIPGGPQSPEQIEAENKAKNPYSGSPEAIDGAAENYLKTGKLPPNMGRGVQGAQEGQRIRQLAYEKARERGIDPQDLPKKWQKFATEQVGIQRFNSGPQGNVIRSLNVVTEHANTLRELGQALKNGDIRLFNDIAQRWATATGTAAPTNFNMAAQLVGTELVKALGVAGAGTKDERENLGKIISQASSPDQIMGALDTVVRPMLGGQLKGLRQQFKSATGLDESAFNDMLTPSVRDWIDAKGAASGPAPKVGERKQFKQGWGIWDGTQWKPE